VSSSLFDPIPFLNLTSLATRQKENLTQPLLADIASFIIDRFIADLNPTQLESFEKHLDTIQHDPFQIIALMEQIDPSFTDRKSTYLDQYKQNFKLQKFLRYL